MIFVQTNDPGQTNPIDFKDLGWIYNKYITEHAFPKSSSIGTGPNGSWMMNRDNHLMDSATDLCFGKYQTRGIQASNEAEGLKGVVLKNLSGPALPKTPKTPTNATLVQLSTTDATAIVYQACPSRI